MTDGLRAVIVAVEYDDLLALTLPYNRHHFSEVLVVTGTRNEDEKTVEIALSHKCHVHRSSAFWHRGAAFNKWAALEESLDLFGREGWLCLMDADVLWPKEIEVRVMPNFMSTKTKSGEVCKVPRGCLMSPLRRMAPWPPAKGPNPVCLKCKGFGSKFVPPKEEQDKAYAEGSRKWYTKQPCDCHTVFMPSESEWAQYPIHRNVKEWAGYTQIFHSEDPALPSPPWHQVNWEHAGGADSIFQSLWAPANKLRPSWEVLHLGEAGQNWYGRATAYADGTLPERANERRSSCARIWEQRRDARARGEDTEQTFSKEKLKSE